MKKIGELYIICPTLEELAVKSNGVILFPLKIK